MPTQRKIDIVTSLTDKINRTRAMVVTDYQGLSHKQLEELRKLLRKLNAEFVVTKNALLKRALGKTKKFPEDALSGSSGVLFAFEDEAGPVKELVNFLKTTNLGTIKAGLLGATNLSIDEVNRLAELPARPMLLSKLTGQLQTPLSGLHNALSWNLRQLVWTLDAVKSKKN
ncbi:TPA: 50S ribosomal protein L10 [Patescibacteria group bacterium]|uniref:Large ribosomal subunit protein uL10 n=1 Tax=Candidatus Gottesmanbacteria bacterium GW2011_GWA1_43_11 TaxID=1618436 RepID=A0A0G1EQB7_9BACT|nr:MAG: 50S ribosomal protein L10 [Candidatus Gottesmanbacteria bacterium GW2011_GWA1_43_11]HCS79462.1 50S ribosomal protein L10 [Patescibacteria group bacterium]